jgi:cob(I)alamin adenosyltransferase
MAELATPPENYEKVPFKITAEDVARLERLSEELKGEVPIQTAFVVPGDTSGGAALDLARTIVRRGERQAVKLFHDGRIANRAMLPFLNRLSDLVFILARYEERRELP